VVSKKKLCKRCFVTEEMSFRGADENNNNDNDNGAVTTAVVDGVIKTPEHLHVNYSMTTPPGAPIKAPRRGAVRMLVFADDDANE